MNEAIQFESPAHPANLWTAAKTALPTLGEGWKVGLHKSKNCVKTVDHDKVWVVQYKRDMFEVLCLVYETPIGKDFPLTEPAQTFVKNAPTIEAAFAHLAGIVGKPLRAAPEALPLGPGNTVSIPSDHLTKLRTYREGWLEGVEDSVSFLRAHVERRKAEGTLEGLEVIENVMEALDRMKYDF